MSPECERSSIKPYTLSDASYSAKISEWFIEAGSRLPLDHFNENAVPPQGKHIQSMTWKCVGPKIVKLTYKI